MKTVFFNNIYKNCIVNKWYKTEYTTILYHYTGIMVQNPIYR